MNFILTHKYADGNTPIRPEEAEQLIPRISTMGELNEYEALNILRARAWAFDGRTMKSLTLWMNYMSESSIAGCSITFGNGPADIVKRNETSDATQERSSSEFPNSSPTRDTGWRTRRSRSDEALLRFHHQLTRIHPFANGNGRHARMIADIVAVKSGQAEFTWGAGKDLVAEGDARSRYLAALRALDANENDVKPLLDFARS